MNRKMNIYNVGNNDSSCDGPFYQISADSIEDFGFDPVPPEDYEAPKKFPECCKFHENTYRNYNKWFETFPSCCENHKKIANRFWFSRENYAHVPDRMINALSYTEYKIETKINNEDWYKDITDYIDYCIHSFGTPPIGADRYVGSVKHYIKNNKPTNSDFPDWKRNRLLEFFENSNSEQTDLNMLYATFQKWVKSIPDLSVFKVFKDSLKGKMPMNIILQEPNFNKYLGLTAYRVRTKSELINVLVEITKKVLNEVNIPELIKTGKLRDKDEHQFEILSSQHLLKQEELLGNFSKGEQKYVKAIKKWLSNEKDYFKSIELIFERVTTIAERKVIENKFDMETERIKKLVDRIIKDEEKLSLLLLDARQYFQDDEDSEELEFIDSELNGYSENKSVPIPNYRRLQGELLADIVDPYGNLQKNVVIDASEFSKQIDLDLAEVLMIDGIGFLEDSLPSLKSTTSHRPLPSQGVKMLGQLVEYNKPGNRVVRGVQSVATASLKNILTQVRNRLAKQLQLKLGKQKSRIETVKSKDKVTTESHEREKISVFVTYAWEESSNELVISFVDFLRKEGYNATMDRAVSQSQTSVDFNEMMIKGMLESDKVIVVLSETYKAKAEKFEGGVGTEYRIIVEKIKKEPNKFIFVSFKSLSEVSTKSILPEGIGNREIIDLKDDQDNNEFSNLHAKLQSINQIEFSDVADATPEVKKTVIKKFKL